MTNFEKDCAMREMRAEERHDSYAVLNRCLPILDREGVKWLFNYNLGEIYKGKRTLKFMLNKLEEWYNWSMIATTELGSASPKECGADIEISNCTKYLKENYPKVIESAIKEYEATREDDLEDEDY